MPSHGFGDQTIGVFVLDNPSNEERETDLSFTGLTDNGTIIVKTVKIKQEAAERIKIEPSNFQFGPQASYKPAFLESWNIGTWGVSSRSAEWCKITPSSGVGSSMIEVQVNRNLGESRNAVIVVTGISDTLSAATIEIQQRGPYLYVSPTSVRLQDVTDFTSVTISSNTVWSATTDAD